MVHQHPSDRVGAEPVEEVLPRPGPRGRRLLRTEFPDGSLALLRAEQRLGRINRNVGPATAADLLLGACLQRAFLSHFTNTDRAVSTDTFATSLVASLFRGIAPGG